MKNFDTDREQRAERDRGFQIGGETFTTKTAVRPEAMTAYEALDDDAPVSEMLKVIDQTILAFVEENGHERWRKLREREDDPVTLADMNALINWLVEDQTGRPTQQPAPSSGGLGSSGTPSTGVSSSRAVKAA